MSRANLTLVGFAGTPASGYAPVVCKNIGQEGSYTNLVTNGDFSQGTTGWTPFSCTLTNVGGVGVSTGNGTGQNVYARQTILNGAVSGKRYYAKLKIRTTTTGATSLQLWLQATTSSLLTAVVSPTQNIWYDSSIIITADGTGNVLINARHNYVDSASSNGKIMEFDEVQFVNLTDNPLVQYLEAQLGRQLTVAECDYLFTFTASTATVKAKTVPFLKYDSTNDYAIGSNPSLEILGASDFGFGRVLSLPTLTTQYFKMKSDSSEATTQYGLKLLNTGVLQIILQGTAIQIATGILPNTMYSIWVERISGVLKCFINGVEVSSVANNTSLTSRANYRDGAMTTAIDGSTLTGYTNQFLGADTIAKENVLQARSAWFNFTLKTFGV